MRFLREDRRTQGLQDDKFYWNFMKANNKLTKIGQIMEET